MNPPERTPDVVSARAPRPLGPYPHARRVGNLLFLSGIGPRHPKTEQIPEGIEAQTRACIENVKAILEDAGSSLEKVVDVTVFLTNIDRDFAAFNRVYGGVLRGAPEPADENDRRRRRAPGSDLGRAEDHRGELNSNPIRLLTSGGSLGSADRGMKKLERAERSAKTL